MLICACRTLIRRGFRILLARHIRSEPKPSGIEVLAFRDLQQLRGFLIDTRKIFQHVERFFE